MNEYSFTKFEDVRGGRWEAKTKGGKDLRGEEKKVLLLRPNGGGEKRVEGTRKGQGFMREMT